MVFFLNHAAWWDPLVALFLAEKFYPRHRPFAPIDAAALRRYPLLERLGFFPVERSTGHGARQFLKGSKAVLASPNHSLWLTPQGHFTDIRDRPLRFEAGLGHLAARLTDVPFIPVAIEYAFWFERGAEVLVAFGTPVDFPPGLGATARTTTCESHLTAAQDQLAAASCRRNPEAFVTLLSGNAGVGGTYDLWRRVRAGLRGEVFVPHHQRPEKT
jgi:1-acyl-sn-glycerol-3-phosphate acyltransferase